jgi:hypothetical protein
MCALATPVLLTGGFSFVFQYDNEKIFILSILIRYLSESSSFDVENEIPEGEVDIIFSRHASRRVKLYGLTELYLKSIIEHTTLLRKGRNETVEYSYEGNYPIKIVFVVEDEYIMVITAYPLKRGLI